MSLLAPSHDSELAQGLVAAIRHNIPTETMPVTLMEVCGTHTMSIRRHGLRSLLPPQVRLISGPGCPVCVTPVSFIDHTVALSRRPGTLIATFGDLVRVPGSSSSLQREQSSGACIKVVYSPLDAVALAERYPDQTVVFLGIGFETTAPAIAGALVTARRKGLTNFFVLNALKTIVNPLMLLASDPDLHVDGFLCPAHVAAVIGSEAFQPLAERYLVPCVITGFEPVDILQGVWMLIQQFVAGRAQVENQYRRVVRAEGNLKAQALIAEVFEPCPAAWRGIGDIPDSGLCLRPEYAAFDAALQLPLPLEQPNEPVGCRCGEILKGRAHPADCPLFKNRCTPEHPIGACMVSGEGTCAAACLYD